MSAFDRIDVADPATWPTLGELGEPVHQGWTDDLHFEDPGRLRVWRSRLTVADGAAADDVVTLETFDGDRWHPVAYDPATLERAAS